MRGTKWGAVLQEDQAGVCGQTGPVGKAFQARERHDPGASLLPLHLVRIELPARQRRDFAALASIEDERFEPAWAIVQIGLVFRRGVQPLPGPREGLHMRSTSSR